MSNSTLAAVERQPDCEYIYGICCWGLHSQHVEASYEKLRICECSEIVPRRVIICDLAYPGSTALARAARNASKCCSNLLPGSIPVCPSYTAAFEEREAAAPATDQPIPEAF